jgi:hypothetical protein
MRIQLGIGSADMIPISCGGALDASQLAAWVRRRRFTVRISIFFAITASP